MPCYFHYFFRKTVRGDFVNKHLDHQHSELEECQSDEDSVAQMDDFFYRVQLENDMMIYNELYRKDKDEERSM